jgi:hypothetical protein
MRHDSSPASGKHAAPSSRAQKLCRETQMSTSSITGDSAALSALQQRRNALKQLDSDAEAGNFAAAQNDLAAFQQLSQSQGAPPAADSSSATASSTASVFSLQSDLTSLLNAALGGASSPSLQSSASSVENDLSGFSAFTNSASTNPLAGALNSLLDAAQTGDAASAKQAAQMLIQDLQGGQGVAGADHGHHHHGGGSSDDLTPTADQLIDPTASASQTQSAGGLPQALLDALDGDTTTPNPNASAGGTRSSGG